MKRYFWLFVLCLMSFPLFAQNYDMVVAKDGSGNYTTIQEAINAVPEYNPTGRYRILVRKGVYEEKVLVPSYKRDVALIGEDKDQTILVWHDGAGMQSYTLRTDANGFECENMTICNDAKDDFALAAYVEGDKVTFRNCHLNGGQYAVFTSDENSRQVYYNCLIEGAGTLLFGPATCWLDHCELHARTNGSISYAATSGSKAYGYVFYRCKVTADDIVTRLYLGKPWRNHASVIFSECELPACVAPEGWHNNRHSDYETTVRFRENRCTGDGASLSKRVAWSRKLNNEEQNNLQVRRVLFQQGDVWESNYRPVDFYALHFAFCDEYQEKGTPYVAGTLEPDSLPENLENFVEPLVMRFNAVDCTTFVEYMCAALLGRCDNPDPNDSIMQRFVQTLRYRGGKRGNYATRKHYFSEWISDNAKQGLMTEVTAQLPGAKKQKKKINFMTLHPNYYPQLAHCNAIFDEVRRVERMLSDQETYYIPKISVRRVLSELQDGDIVAFVTDKSGLDISHVGFVWQRDSWHDEPHLLHASSTQGRVVVSQATLSEYLASLKNCLGIRVIRLNTD